MRSVLHKTLTIAFLAAYASVMVIGEGLHSLVPGHQHLHGQCVITHSDGDHEHGHSHRDHGCGHHSHSDGCHDHDHGNNHTPAGPSFAATDSDFHSHLCDICAFLYQAVSQPPQVATTPDLHPFVAELTHSVADRYASAVLGLHAARGPPLLGA